MISGPIRSAGGGSIFHNFSNFESKVEPMWCSLSKTAGGHLAIGNYIRYKVEAILDPKNSKKLAYQYRKKTTFFLQKILYYLPILERKRGTQRDIVVEENHRFCGQPTFARRSRFSDVNRGSARPGEHAAEPG